MKVTEANRTDFVVGYDANRADTVGKTHRFDSADPARVDQFAVAAFCHHMT